MSSNRIRRHQRAIAALSLTTELATTGELDTSEVAGGAVLVPAGSSITTLTWYGAVQPGGTYVPIYEAAGQVTHAVAAERGYAVPDACFGFGAIKIVADAEGSVGVSLKG